MVVQTAKPNGPAMWWFFFIALLFFAATPMVVAQSFVDLVLARYPELAETDWPQLTELSLADSGLLAGAETYAANLEEAVANGVFGAPFYIVDGAERFWGQDKLEDLELHLQGKL